MVDTGCYKIVQKNCHVSIELSIYQPYLSYDKTINRESYKNSDDDELLEALEQKDRNQNDDVDEYQPTFDSAGSKDGSDEDEDEEEEEEEKPPTPKPKKKKVVRRKKKSSDA